MFHEMSVVNCVVLKLLFIPLCPLREVHKTQMSPYVSIVFSLESAKGGLRILVKLWLIKIPSEMEVTRPSSQKKCTNRTKSCPKLRALGLNFIIEMTWVRLILLSLSKNNQKIKLQTQGVPTNGD